MTENNFNPNRSTEKREWVTIQIDKHLDNPNQIWVLQELAGHTYTDDPDRIFHKADKYKTRVALMERKPGGKLVNVDAE